MSHHDFSIKTDQNLIEIIKWFKKFFSIFTVNARQTLAISFNSLVHINYMISEHHNTTQWFIFLSSNNEVRWRNLKHFIIIFRIVNMCLRKLIIIDDNLYENETGFVYVYRYVNLRVDFVNLTKKKTISNIFPFTFHRINTYITAKIFSNCLRIVIGNNILLCNVRYSK